MNFYSMAPNSLEPGVKADFIQKQQESIDESIKKHKARKEYIEHNQKMLDEYLYGKPAKVTSPQHDVYGNIKSPIKSVFS